MIPSILNLLQQCVQIHCRWHEPPSSCQRQNYQILFSNEVHEHCPFSNHNQNGIALAFPSHLALRMDKSLLRLPLIMFSERGMISSLSSYFSFKTFWMYSKSRDSTLSIPRLFDTFANTSITTALRLLIISSYVGAVTPANDNDMTCKYQD